MSGDSRRKRAASEPVEVLVASDDETHALSSARPLATTLGSLFVFGRGIAGLFWIGAFLLAWPALADEEHVAADERGGESSSNHLGASLVSWGVGVIGTTLRCCTARGTGGALASLCAH